jgi:hypothetical protein
MKYIVNGLYTACVRLRTDFLISKRKTNFNLFLLTNMRVEKISKHVY